MKRRILFLTLLSLVIAALLIQSHAQKQSSSQKAAARSLLEKLRKPNGDNASNKPTNSSTASKQDFTINGVKFKMILVHGGTFAMGATREQGEEVGDDEKPVHNVTLPSFYISQTEVTQELWNAVMGEDNNPSTFLGAKRPVEGVTWDDCQEFIRKLNKLTGKNFRLPTEAEWEFAARGGNRSMGFIYSGSNTLSDVAWYWANSGDEFLRGEWDWDKIEVNNCRTHDVATLLPNELGIYDMSGNVWEWCQDWYDAEYYRTSPSNNPKGPKTGEKRVNRGGGGPCDLEFCRVSIRSGDDPDMSEDAIGFRLAL